MEGKKLYQEFKTLYNENKYKEALVLIDKLILMNESKAKYFNYKGVCLDNIGGRDREKLECYDKAVRLDDKNTKYITNKGAALVELGEYDEAHRVLDFSLKLGDKDSDTYYWKGRAFYLQSKYFKSLEYMDKCLINDPKFSNAHYCKGLSLREINCFGDSIKEFDLAIKLNPDDSENFYNKALSLIKMEEYDKAITELNKSINIYPNDTALLDNKATCLIKLNKLEEALIVTEQSLNIWQNNSEALKNKAEIYLKQDKPKEALKLMYMEIQATPEFYELKGLILHKLSKEEEAIDCFLKAIGLKDKNNKTMIENMSSIIDNYKNRIPKSELENLKELNENCLKELTEIKSSKLIKQSLDSFSEITKPLNWNHIQIDKSEIINHQDIEESYFCKICLSLVKFPKSCKSCDDLFCTECLNKSLEGNNSCPNCRVSPFIEYRLNKIAKNIYNRIEIYCPLECGEKLIIENFEKHLTSCVRREKLYECNLCKGHCEDNQEVEAHKNVCPEIMFKCEMCNIDLSNKFVKEHMKICLGKMVKCKDCQCAIPLKYQDSHKDCLCNMLNSVMKNAKEMQMKLMECLRKPNSRRSMRLSYQI